MPVGKERVAEIMLYFMANGEAETLKNFELTAESLARYIREAKKIYGISAGKKIKTITKIAEQYDEQELRILSKGRRVLPDQKNAPRIDFEGKRIRIGAMGDTHIGSIYTDDDYIYKAFEEFEKAKVEFITHNGDVTEGMSGRPGHIYELTHIGYDQQKTHSIDIFSQAPAPVYMIDGNHDRWYIKSNGAIIVKDICGSLENATFLGHDEGDIILKNDVILRLWHGEDGNSYAVSYRLQKIVESFTGGEKPNVMFCGHTHKTAWLPNERNIEIFSCGSIQKQSKWMRGKRIAAHTGFWIIDIWVNNLGVSACRGKWFPFYS